MIGDKRYAEALDVRGFRSAGVVGERRRSVEAGAEATVESLRVRMQT
jgi:hypothetical protein